MDKHRVTTHNWKDSFLHKEENFFNSLDEAMDHVKLTNSYAVKVTNAAGEVVYSHQSTGVPVEFQAKEVDASEPQ